MRFLANCLKDSATKCKEYRESAHSTLQVICIQNSMYNLHGWRSKLFWLTCVPLGWWYARDASEQETWLAVLQTTSPNQCIIESINWEHNNIIIRIGTMGSMLHNINLEFDKDGGRVEMSRSWNHILLNHWRRGSGIYTTACDCAVLSNAATQ